MRYFLLIFGLAVLGVMVIAGKRGDLSRKPPIYIFPDMDRQAKLRPQKESEFFPDLMSSRLPVEGTVARGATYEITPETTGMLPDSTNYVEHLPVALTEKLMARGQERYTISCAPCHGAQGDGNGITKSFGMTVIGNLHDPRMVSMTDGELFYVITHGRNLMGSYAAQVAIPDRWAIVAYVRALQRSRLGSPEDVVDSQRARFAQ